MVATEHVLFSYFKIAMTMSTEVGKTLENNSITESLTVKKTSACETILLPCIHQFQSSPPMNLPLASLKPCLSIFPFTKAILVHCIVLLAWYRRSSCVEYHAGHHCPSAGYKLSYSGLHGWLMLFIDALLMTMAGRTEEWSS